MIADTLSDEDIEAIQDMAREAALHCGHNIGAASNPYQPGSEQAEIYDFAFRSAYARENGR